MKRSLDALPLIIEDVIVQVDVVARCGRIADGSMFGYWVLRRGQEGDAGDANLMWHLLVDFVDRQVWQRAYPGVIHAAWAFRGLSGSELME